MSNLFHKIIQGKKFNFQPINLGHDTGYHVDVEDEEGTRWEFTMEPEDEGHWKLKSEKLPLWLKAFEDELQSVINQHE